MYLGVDVGGTKTLLVVFDVDGKIKESLKFETPEQYDEFISTLEANVANLATKDFRAACMAVPGRIDRKEGVARAFGNRPWVDVPIGQDAEKIFDCPLIIENDAKLAALSEARYIIKDFKKVLYITVSTGIGGGFIINGKIDPNFQDMEVGQLLLEHDGKLMDWEDFGSGRAFQKKFGTRVSETDPQNTAAWYYLARNIAIGLIDLIVTLTPEAIILGGGVGAHYDLFKDRLAEELEIYENPLVPIPPIFPAKHAEEAVINGCWDLLKERYAKSAK